MNIKLFFNLYAGARTDAEFRQVLSLLLKESTENADLKGIAKGLQDYPELLKGKEKEFIALFDKAMQQFLEPKEGEGVVKQTTIFSFLPVFELPVMREFMFQTAGPAWDVGFAKKMVKLFGIAHASFSRPEVGHFFLEVLPKLAEKYPLTMRALFTEIQIRNRNALKVGAVTDIWVQLEEVYGALQKKN